MIARILVVLSFCGLAWLGISYLGAAGRIQDLKDLPTWPDKTSEMFQLEGAEGTWKVEWHAVPDAVGNGTLWVATEAGWSPGEGLSVLARVNPSTALISARSPEPDGWIRIRQYPDFTDQAVIDPKSVRFIEYRIVAVPPELEGKAGWLWVQGSGDSDHYHEAVHREAANIFGSILLATPMLLVLIGSLIVVFVRRRRARAQELG